MDQFDRAQEITDLLFRVSVLNRQKLSGQSLTHCLECGEEIPEKRRKAAPGCQYCVSCAEDLERG